MRLHDLKMSSNAKRVRVTAFELNLPLELVPVNPQAGENRRPEYLGKNPMGKVPTFEDGDFVLWESLAIMEYLCSKAPGQTLLPADARARGGAAVAVLQLPAHPAVAGSGGQRDLAQADAR